MIGQQLSQTNEKCYSVLQCPMWLFLLPFYESKHSHWSEHATIPHINLIQLPTLPCRASTSGQAPLPMVLASTSTRCNIRGQRHSRPGDAASRSSGTHVQGSDSRPGAAALRHPRATARVKGRRHSCPGHREQIDCGGIGRADEIGWCGHSFEYSYHTLPIVSWTTLYN